MYDLRPSARASCTREKYEPDYDYGLTVNRITGRVLGRKTLGHLQQGCHSRPSRRFGEQLRLLLAQSPGHRCSPFSSGFSLIGMVKRRASFDSYAPTHRTVHFSRFWRGGVQKSVAKRLGIEGNGQYLTADQSVATSWLTGLVVATTSSHQFGRVCRGVP